MGAKLVTCPICKHGPVPGCVCLPDLERNGGEAFPDEPTKPLAFDLSDAITRRMRSLPPPSAPERVRFDWPDAADPQEETKP